MAVAIVVQVFKSELPLVVFHHSSTILPTVNMSLIVSCSSPMGMEILKRLNVSPLEMYLAIEGRRRKTWPRPATGVALKVQNKGGDGDGDDNPSSLKTLRIKRKIKKRQVCPLCKRMMKNWPKRKPELVCLQCRKTLKLISRLKGSPSD